MGFMKKMKVNYLQATSTDSFGTDARRDASRRALAKAIALTAEVCGQALSPAAVDLLALDLSDFADNQVLAALARCRMELQGPLKIAEILARLDDGRPDADEAWNMMPRDESASVVWTDEMAECWGVALPMLEAGDAAAARNAFRESYARAVLQARIRRAPPRWTPSLGRDPAARERVLLDAVQKRRLTPAHAEQLLPSLPATGAEQIIAQVKIKSLH